jgi:hypothetical protein
MQRHALGIVAIVCLIAAVVFEIVASTDPRLQATQAGCWRLGLFFGVWWLAYPQAVRVPRWLWVAIPVLIFILVFSRKWFVLALPIVIVLAILLPRPRR